MNTERPKSNKLEKQEKIERNESFFSRKLKAVVLAGVLLAGAREAVERGFPGQQTKETTKIETLVRSSYGGVEETKDGPVQKGEVETSEGKIYKFSVPAGSVTGQEGIKVSSGEKPYTQIFKSLTPEGSGVIVTVSKAIESDRVDIRTEYLEKGKLSKVIHSSVVSEESGAAAK